MSIASLPALLLTALVTTAAEGSLVPQVSPQDSLPSVEGWVRTDASGFLSGAIVEVRQNGRVRRNKVGPDGNYRFDGLRSGTAELSVFHLAAHPFHLRLELPVRGRVHLDLVLRHRVIPVAGLHVRAVPEPRLTERSGMEASPSRVSIGLRALDASSGLAESGLAGALSVDEPGEPGGVLYTRGSTVDARLVLLDGAPILTPFHVAGLVEPFDVRLLQSADLYLGGAPSPYNGGVSYLLDVETRAARRDRPRLTLGADGLTVDALGELPLPLEGSLLFGGRSLHGLQESIGKTDRFPYRYYDLLVRAGFSPAVGHEIRVTGFQNREGVRLDLGVDPSPVGGEAFWGNRAVSFRYDAPLGGVDVDVMGAASRYDSSLPISWTDPVLASGIGDRLRVSGTASAPVEGGIVRVGAAVERSSFEYELHQVRENAISGIVDGPLGLGTTEVGFFGEWDGSLTSDLALRAGLRADRFSHEGRLRMSPRILVRLALSDRVELFSAAGRYHQALPAPGLSGRPGAQGSSAELSWDPTLPVAAASHLVVGVAQELDREINLTLSAFAKTFSGLGQAGGDRSRASGTELKVSREGDRVSGWFGYALSWFWVDEGPTGSTRFDGRHLLTAGLEGAIPGGVELRGTVGYGAGLPMTAVGLPSQGDGTAAPLGDFQSPAAERVFNTGGGGAPLELAPEGDFLRMDLELSWTIEPRVGGHRTELQPYLKILNALNRRDALFYYFDEWHEDTARPLATRPVLPLLGLRWRF